METNELSLFFKKIVSENFEDELSTFEKTADEVIKGTIKNIDESNKYKEEILEFEFGQAVELSFKFIEIIIATIPLIIELWKLKKEYDRKNEEKARIITSKNIEINWKKELLKQGLSEEESYLIANKYKDDFKDLINNIN